MTVQSNTLWRRWAKRFVVLGLAALAPAVASARVPYQSKSRPAVPPATQASSTTPAAPAPQSSASPSPTTKNVADVPALPPVGGDDQAKAGNICAAISGLPTLGTAVHWVATPDEAGKLAEKEHKLVFLIQVSGNFARQEFT